ncbi:MAG: DUF4124 domain-containing protein [Polaromonas sp.]
MKRFLAVLASSIMSLSPLYATDIYRWVDENGRTQLSDVVPEKYRKSATHVNSQQYELSAEQVRKAEERVAREKARAAEAMQRQLAAEAVEAANAASAASAASAAKNSPRPPAAGGSDCDALYRQYGESQECFAPYRNVNGSTKAEAFEICGSPVLSPELKCGSPKSE